MRRSAFLAGFASIAASPTGRRIGLRVAADPFGHDIDPYRDSESGVDELAWLYADGLVGWGLETTPLLAARLPEIGDGGRRLRYRLRRAVWHDGQAFIAEDVARALTEVRATVWGTHQPYRSIRELVVTGDHDFEVILNSPVPGFVRSFFGPYGTPALPLLRRAADGTPIGTGPFAVRARPERQRWRLERYDASPRGSPRADEIHLRILSSDMTADVQLLSGEADIALPLTPNAIAPERFTRVRRTTSVTALVLNAQRSFGTIESRRAFAAAVDVPRLQRAYDRTRTALFASLLLSGRNDAALARALAYDPNAAPTLKSAVGSREPIIAYVGDSRAHERTATLLQQALHDAGLPAVLRPVPAVLYMTGHGPLRDGEFDVALAGFAYDREPDLAADWACANVPPQGGNFGRWCDAKFESAIRRNDAPSALRRLYDTLACVPLSRAYEDIGISPRVIGFVTPSPLVPATYSCTRWSLA